MLPIYPYSWFGDCHIGDSYLNWKGLITGMTTGLTQTAIKDAGQRLNMLIQPVTSLMLVPVFPSYSRGQRSHNYLISFNNKPNII